MRDEYTRSRFMERIAAMQVARLVALKIARINIRARHCHSVNFPRCWLYASERRKGVGARTGGTQGREKGVAEGGQREKHRYPYPPRWNFMRFALSMQRTRASPAAFSLHPRAPFTTHPYASPRWHDRQHHR